LFICKTSYYKQLLKLQRATEKVEAIIKEIQDAFQARPGAKRLPCPSDGNDDEISDVQRSLSTNGVKVSRTLPFSNNISTPRASSFSSQAVLAGVNPLSHVLSPTQNAGPSYRVFLHVQTTQDFLPLEIIFRSA